jgi:hypothetical protein
MWVKWGLPVRVLQYESVASFLEQEAVGSGSRISNTCAYLLVKIMRYYRDPGAGIGGSFYNLDKNT